MEGYGVVFAELLDINKIVAAVLTAIVVGAYGIVKWVVRLRDRERVKFDVLLTEQRKEFERRQDDQQKRFDERLRHEGEVRGLEWEKRDMQASRDRHDLRNELQTVRNELYIANVKRERLEDQLKHTEQALAETKQQVLLKDREISKLRDQVDYYTRLLIERGVKAEDLTDRRAAADEMESRNQ